MKLPNFLPDQHNPTILNFISILGIQELPFYVDIIPENYGFNSNCFENVKFKVLFDGGELIHGWQFCEFEYMVEAEFHAIWKSETGDYVDITIPGNPYMNKTLFVVDRNRCFQGVSVDNFRFNTTNNPLVDDMIEVDKWRYRFLNSDHRVNFNEVDFIGDDFEQLEIIDNWMFWLDTFYESGGGFEIICCEKNIPYCNCHRLKLLENIGISS